MIKQIKIRDFKSIREVELNLDPVTVLIGRSGTGKSNLVHAIRFLRNVLINQQQAINYEWGWERIVPVGEKEARPSIEVTFSVPGETLDYNYRIGFERRPPSGWNPVLTTEHLLVGGEPIFSRTL